MYGKIICFDNVDTVIILKIRQWKLSKNVCYKLEKNNGREQATGGLNMRELRKAQAVMLVALLGCQCCGVAWCWREWWMQIRFWVCN